MKNISILLLVVINLTFAQNDTLLVYMLQDNKPVSNFEIAFLQEIQKRYNSLNKKQFFFHIQKLTSYKELFNLSHAENSTNFAALSSISITKERKNKYAFSTPYMPVRQILVASVNRKNYVKDWKNKKMKLGVNPNTKHLKESIKLQKKYGFNIIYYNQSEQPSFLAGIGEIDFYLTDSAELWENNTIFSISDFKDGENSAFAIMFNRFNPFVKIFDKIIFDYINSSEYENLITKYLGLNAKQFFIDHKYLLDVKNF